MTAPLALKAQSLVQQKDYESAIDVYSELCMDLEEQGFSEDTIPHLIDYANCLFQNAMMRNDIFDRQQQEMLKKSDQYQQRYQALPVEEEEDDFQVAFEILERAKSIAIDNKMSNSILLRIEQLLGDICFEDSNFQQALESYEACLSFATEEQLPQLYYFIAMVHEFANSPSDTMDSKDSSTLPMTELERIQKAREYVQKCLDIVKEPSLKEDVRVKVISIDVDVRIG